MNKILYILLFACSFSYGQHAPFSPKSKETTTWTAQCGTYPSATTVYAVNQFILAENSNGNWALYDRFWLFAQDIQANARKSIKNPTSTDITEVNTPSWSSGLGYTGNGTSSYENSNFTPSTDGVNYTLNSASMFVYSRTNSAVTSVEIGSNTTSGGFAYMHCKYSDNSAYAFTNNNGSINVSGAVSSSIGFFAWERTASNADKIMRNGVNLGTSAGASYTLPGQKVYIGARNANGTAVAFSSRQLSFAGVGGGGIDYLKAFNNAELMRQKIGF